MLWRIQPVRSFEEMAWARSCRARWLESCTWSRPFAVLIGYSFTYFTAFGMLVIPAPMVFNSIVNGSPDTVSASASFAFGVWGVVNMVRGSPCRLQWMH